jgi:MFS family permease
VDGLVSYVSIYHTKFLTITSEMDHTVLYNCQNYAASDFGQIPSLGALQTAGTIIIAVMKPPIAKISDVAGRVETYICVVLLYIISYILCATAPSFEQYAGGYVIYSIGATGMQILNQIIVADITTSRWRGLANGLINLPFMIIPWISAFIVESALDTIGWRWGIGMFAIIMPTVSLGIIVPLLHFRRRGKKAGKIIHRPAAIKTFFIAIDFLGTSLLAVGCAMFLLPLSLAGNVSGGWSNPWIPTVMVVGIVFLAVFGFYETRYAENPVMPARYFKNASPVLACLIGLLDAFAFQVTHTYMYPWSTVVHDFSAREATFLTYTSGCFQVLAGLVTGYLMFRSRRYKWLLIIGVVIRLIGYGAMLRLRGSNNPTAELIIVQAIQGLGSGTVGTVVLVIAQIVVSKSELAQATALILLAIFMGQAIGSAVAGAIYTNLFKTRLRVHLGSSVSQSTINNVFDSITSQLPTVGTMQRTAINTGVSISCWINHFSSSPQSFVAQHNTKY